MINKPTITNSRGANFNRGKYKKKLKRQDRKSKNTNTNIYLQHKDSPQCNVEGVSR